MIEGNEKKTSMKNDEHKNEESCNNAETPEEAKERLKLNSADVEQDQNNFQGQPAGDDGIYELPALFNLITQR